MVGPGWKDSRGKRHNYTEENYEEELINDIDKRINGQLNLAGIEEKENPFEEYQTELFRFLTKEPQGEPLANYIGNRPKVLDELYFKAVGDKIKSGEEVQPHMTAQESEQASYGIPLPDSQIEIIPNLNEDTILIRRKSRSWSSFIITKQTKNGQVTYERYRDKKTGRFIKKPQITHPNNMRVM